MPAAGPAGETVLQLARPHVGEKYVLGVMVPKNNPNWTGPWDCSEFASWVVFQAAAKLYGCDRDNGNPSTADAFTGYWERDAKSLGQIVTIDQAARTPGATVLRIPQVGATGHIVISDGSGGTVEAHSSKDGVIQSTLANRRWDMGVLVPGIAYTQRPDVKVLPPGTAIYRLTTPMMSGEKVLQIQQALKTAGFDPGPPDGEFGSQTHAAVVAFQLSNQLLPDGEVGPATAAALGVQI
ncbi:MAG: peptidoglycan-binding domain-containing protein [Terriglobia bacterium]